MSHEATSWAVKQRGIPPAAKIVLWHLADRHHPDHGCFPSQDRLASDCEMSRSSVNNHLKLLEKFGLIRRQKRLNPATKRQESTFYILGFEMVRSQDVDEPCPDIGHGAVSKKEPDPCPDSDESRVQNLDTNLVRGTSKGTNARDPDARDRGDTITQDDLDRIWNAYPDDGKVSDAPGNLVFWLRDALVTLGSVSAVLTAVLAYARACRKHDSRPKAIRNFLTDRPLLRRYAPAKDVPEPGQAQRWEALTEVFARREDWEGEGPAPGQPGCRVPAAIQRKYGFEPASPDAAGDAA